jgi:hypothetical protein
MKKYITKIFYINRNITLKTLLCPIRINVRLPKIKLRRLCKYTVYMVGMQLPAIHVLLAKYGFIDTLAHLGLNDVRVITKFKFPSSKYNRIRLGSNIWLEIPKSSINKDTTFAINAFISAIPKDISEMNLYNQDYWISKLGGGRDDRGERMLTTMEYINSNYKTSPTVYEFIINTILNNRGN